MQINHRINRRMTIGTLWFIVLVLIVINLAVVHHLLYEHETYFAPLLICTLAMTAIIIACLALVPRFRGPEGAKLERRLIHAGNWIMQTALDADDSLTNADNQEAVGLEVRSQLNTWFRNFKHELFDGSMIQTTEMARDLELARDFQLAYLNRPYPKIPAVHLEGRLRLTFYHRYEPALALGGDFFDILTLGPDTAGIFISDVMGHGTRSALITAVLRTQLRDIAERGRNAALFMHDLNDQFCRTVRTLPEPLFASAFYFIADTTTRVGMFSSAGHPAPFHIQRGTGRVGQVSRLKVGQPQGAALGLIKQEYYSGGQCRLNPGDVFIFFTDGLYEAPNPKGEELGIPRVTKLLKKLMYKDAKGIVDGLIDEVNEFLEGEPIPDDLCLVAVEVTDKEEMAADDDDGSTAETRT